MTATPPDHVPDAVLTGFLGSGKIALLNRLLSERHAKRIAVAGNEPGEAGGGGVPAEERLCELDCGYVYCAVRGDLIRVLGALMRRRDPIDHALIETIGLADPAPLVRTVLDDGDPKSQLERNAAVTVVDALHVSLHLDPLSPTLPPEGGGKGGGQEQNAFADVVLLDLGSRKRARDQATEEVLARPGRYHEVRDGLRVKEVLIGDGERRRRYVVCHMPAEEARQRQHRAELLGELEAELRSLAREDGAPSKRAPALLASSRYGRYLRETAGSKLRIDRAAIADAERYDGKWVVTSSDDTLAVEDLALGHERLMSVEACWHGLKSSLRSRSVRHLHPWPTQTHLMTSLLALLLERVMEVHAGTAWRDVADALHQIEVVETDPALAPAGRASEVGERAAARLARSA